MSGQSVEGMDFQLIAMPAEEVFCQNGSFSVGGKSKRKHYQHELSFYQGGIASVVTPFSGVDLTTGFKKQNQTKNHLES